MDDIIIYAKTVGEHNVILEEVFSRLLKHDARLNKEKCEFHRNKIEFLGHIIDGKQVSPPLSKTKAIIDYEAPKDQKELQRFHGLINYLREYIPDFANISAPLTKLLKKNEPYNWNEEQQQSFEELKHI